MNSPARTHVGVSLHRRLRSEGAHFTRQDGHLTQFSARGTENSVASSISRLNTSQRPEHLGNDHRPFKRELSGGNSDRCPPEGCPSDGLHGWTVNTMAGVVIGLTAALCFGPALLIMCSLQRLCCFASGGCVDRCIVRCVGNSEHYADAIDGDSAGIRSSQVGALLDDQMRPERPNSAQLRGRLSIAQSMSHSHGQGGGSGSKTPPMQRRLSRSKSFGSGRFSSVADIIAHAQELADGIVARETAGKQNSASVPAAQQATPPAAEVPRRKGSITVSSPLKALSAPGGIEMVPVGNGPVAAKHTRNGSDELIGTPGAERVSSITRPNSSSLPKDIDGDETPAGGVVTLSPLQAVRVPASPREDQVTADSKAGRSSSGGATEVSLVAPPVVPSPRHSMKLLAQLHRTGSTRFFADAPVQSVGSLTNYSQGESKNTAGVQPWTGDDASSAGTSDVRQVDADTVHDLGSSTPSPRSRAPEQHGMASRVGPLPRLSIQAGASQPRASVFNMLRGADSGSVGNESDGPIKRKQRASLVLSGSAGGAVTVSALKQGGFITANPLRQVSAGSAARQRRRSAILTAASAGATSSAWSAARRGSGGTRRASLSPKQRRHSSNAGTGEERLSRRLGRDVSLSDADLGAKAVTYPEDGIASVSDSDDARDHAVDVVSLGLSPPQRGLGGHSPDHVTLSLEDRQGSAEDSSSVGAGGQVPAVRRRSNSLGTQEASSIQRNFGMPAALALSRRASAGELYSLEAIPESTRPASGGLNPLVVVRQGNTASRGSRRGSTGTDGADTPTTFDDDKSSWL